MGRNEYAAVSWASVGLAHCRDSANARASNGASTVIGPTAAPPGTGRCSRLGRRRPRCPPCRWTPRLRRPAVMVALSGTKSECSFQGVMAQRAGRSVGSATAGCRPTGRSVSRRWPRERVRERRRGGRRDHQRRPVGRHRGDQPGRGRGGPCAGLGDEHVASLDAGASGQGELRGRRVDRDRDDAARPERDVAGRPAADGEPVRSQPEITVAVRVVAALSSARSVTVSPTEIPDVEATWTSTLLLVVMSTAAFTVVMKSAPAPEVRSGATETVRSAAPSRVRRR